MDRKDIPRIQEHGPISIKSRIKSLVDLVFAPIKTNETPPGALSRRKLLQSFGVLGAGSMFFENPFRIRHGNPSEVSQTYENIKPTQNFPVAKEIDDLAKEAGDYFGINHKILLAIMIVEGGGGSFEQDPCGAGILLNPENQEEILNNKDLHGDFFIPQSSLMSRRNIYGAEGIGTTDNDWNEFGQAIYLKYPELRNDSSFKHTRENLRVAFFTLAMKIKMESKSFKDTQAYRKNSAKYDQEKVKMSALLFKKISAQQKTGNRSEIQKIIDEPIDIEYQVMAIERHYGNSTQHFPRLNGNTYPEFVAAYIRGRVAPYLEVLIYDRTQAYKKTFEKNKISQEALKAKLETCLQGKEVKSNWHALALLLSELGLEPDFLGQRDLTHYLKEHVYKSEEPKILWDSAEKQKAIFDIMTKQGIFCRYPSLLSPHPEYMTPDPREVMKNNQCALAFTKESSGKNIRIFFTDQSNTLSSYEYDKKKNTLVLVENDPSQISFLYVFEQNAFMSVIRESIDTF